MIRTRVLQYLKGGAAWPSLFVFGAALLLLAASYLAGNGFRWVAIALLLLACAPWRRLPANSLGIATGLYCAWLLVNAVFVTPVYVAEGIYRPLMLLGGFASIAALGRESSLRLFQAGIAVSVILVLIGLLQYFFGFWVLNQYPGQASATFLTPNTFATAINLFLLPVAALYLTGNDSPRIYVLALWLFAGLVASLSRGGMLAFIAGLAFTMLCIGRTALWQQRKPALRLLTGWMAVWIAFHLATILFAPSTRVDIELPSSVHKWFATDDAAGYRTKIYVTTLGLILDRPVTGAGANMFSPLFEAVKPEFFRDRVHPLAHNDYLQVWLEFGAPGLVLLVALVVASLLRALQSGRRALHDPLPLACGAALASCFAHAVVDYPLYVPFTVMLTGGYLGALAAFVGDRRSVNESIATVFEKAGHVVTIPIRWALAFLALAWLAQPLIADIASRKAVAELLANRVNSGLYWQSVARRLEPRNAVHYWAEAVIWRDQAVEAGDRVLAARAEALFIEEIRVNPYDIAPYVELARFHRQYPQLFDRPTSPAEILDWTGKALKLRPGSLLVQAEHARALAFAGRTGEARRMLRGMQAWHPESKLTRDLAAELPAAD